MPEKPKRGKDDREKTGGVSEKADDGSWGKDIESKDYYYDDAHGYETYEPDDEPDDDGED